MPYYTDNPLYLMREQRFGKVVRFTRDVRQRLTLDDYLRDGLQLQARFNRPVVVVLQHRLRTDRPFQHCEVHVWLFSTTPEQVRRFQGAARRIASFGPVTTDESFDAYVLTTRAGGVDIPPRPTQPSAPVRCRRDDSHMEAAPE
jgi:hypothetical protein